MSTNAAFPSRHVPLDGAPVPRQGWTLELAAPLALGQRGLVVAPARCGASTVLRWMAQAVQAHVAGVEVHAVLCDQPIDEPLEWRDDVPGCVVHATSTGEHDTADHVALRAVFDRAAERAQEGVDVAVFVDSFGALARALAVTSDAADARILSGGMAQTALVALRSAFSRARAHGGDLHGSLTIIGSVRADSAMELDEVVQHELVSTGNVEWHLSDEIRQAGIFPPVDVMRSGARRAELILGEREAHAQAQLRAEVDRHGPIAGLGLLVDRIDELGSLAAVVREVSAATGGDGR